MCRHGCRSWPRTLASALSLPLLVVALLPAVSLTTAAQAIASDDGGRVTSASKDTPASTDTSASALARRDLALLEQQLATMPASRPGHPDLYVIGFAGDGNEDVFRNEVDYLDTLASKRLDADGRVIGLVNHPDSLQRTPRPLATLANLRIALDGIGARMDRNEDILLLYITTHGSEDHQLAVQLEGQLDTGLSPKQLRGALDHAGIDYRVLVVSACYSGGFIPALRGPRTLVLTAARRDRPSFGCGSESTVTWFGRAWLVEGLNRDSDPVEAFQYAKRQISRREAMEEFEPSFPQSDIGKGIVGQLRAWQATLPATAAVPYPHPID